MRLPMISIFAAATAFAGAALGQSVISAHSGVIHYVEGRALLDGQPVEPKFAQFPDVKAGHELRTEDGRVEVLLTPGAFLRMSENSAIRMVSVKLTDTKLEVLAGSVMVECADMMKDNAVTLVSHETNISLLKNGLYRVDAETGRVRVYEGEAEIASASDRMILKKGHEAQLGPVITATKFNPKEGDELYRWSARRARYLSMANVAAAKSLRDNGYVSGYSNWAWNPWYGMFTFIPGSGILYSPFGYGYYSPGMVYYITQPVYAGGGGSGSVYNPNPHFDSNLGYNVSSRSDMGSTAVSAPVRNSGGFTSAAPSTGGSISTGGGAMHGGGSSGGHGH